MGDPRGAGVAARLLRLEQGADRLALEHLAQPAPHLPRGHHAARAELGRLRGGADLRRHPAGAHGRARAAGEREQLGGELGHVRDQLRLGVLARVGVEEPLDVGEHDEQLGGDEPRDQPGQGVVVAELELVDRDGVVLVDDRHHPFREQPLEDVARVEVAAAVLDVVVGEQDLGDLAAPLLERRLVGLHQPALADRRARLLPGDVLRPRREPEPLDPERDRARGDDHELAPLGGVEQVRGERLEVLAVEAPGGVGERVGADLHHHAAAGREGRVHARNLARAAPRRLILTGGARAPPRLCQRHTAPLVEGLQETPPTCATSSATPSVSSPASCRRSGTPSAAGSRPTRS